MEELDENTTQKLLTVILTWGLMGPIFNFKLKPFYVVFRHSGAMKAFCVKCGVFASIQGLECVAELYRVSDGYLSDYMKKRIQIKPDSHCLPRAVFNGLKKKVFCRIITITKNYFEMTFLTLNSMIYAAPGCQIRKKKFSEVWQNIKMKKFTHQI